MDQEIDVLRQKLRETEQRLEEERARRQAAEADVDRKLKSALDFLPVLIFGMDENGGVMFLNQAFQRVVGYTATEICSRPELVDYLFPQIADVGEKNRPRDWTVRAQNGERKVISWSETAPCPLPSWSHWKVGLDITELNKLERLRDDVAQIVRHDMMSPLCAVLGLSSLMREDKTLSQEQREIMGQIEYSGKRLRNMLENSLDMYKIEKGTYQYIPEPVDLAAVMATVECDLSDLAAGYRVRRRYWLNGQDLANAAHCYIPGVRALLENMMDNLVKNAIEASPAEGVVTVTVTTDEQHVRIDVHNAGVIPVAVRENFFQPYVTHGKKRGTGLGAYSARLIARAHKGDISFTSESEQGTHMVVTLPLP